MRYLLTGLGIMLCGISFSQSIFISRIVPGNYLSDNRHRVEFYNPDNSAQSLEGFLIPALLVTADQIAHVRR